MDVARLMFAEGIRVDSERLESLIFDLGEQTAERTLCRALEEAACRINRLERALRTNDRGKVCQGARELSELAGSIGLSTLSRVSRDVSQVAMTNDLPALAATTARLARIGEASLMSVWRLRDEIV